MQTKLVYVLTCAPEATYIEQALISIWSARYHNPDAHIVLIVDDKTNQLLVGNRAEVLEYISEKVVVPFEDETASMMYRSRFLKTQVRQLVQGDLLFIDCDTIIQESLCDIDSFTCNIAMVLDLHSHVDEFEESLKKQTQNNSLKLGYDILKEKSYFNSGVIYAKDSEDVHVLCNLWHKYWLDGVSIGINIDQVALGKANFKCNHIIEELSREWNTLVYMNPKFITAGKILHFWNFKNKSFIFCNSYLRFVQKNGLTDYVKDCILNPVKSLLPFDNILHETSIMGFVRFWWRIQQEKSKYAGNIDKNFTDFPWDAKYSLVRKFIKIKILKRRNTNCIYYT